MMLKTCHVWLLIQNQRYTRMTELLFSIHIWGWRRVISYWATWKLLIILKDLIYECLIPLTQRFSIPVLAPPRSAYFVCYSYRLSALRSGHHRIFLHDSSSKRTYIFHSKCIEVCKTWIKIVYIYRGIWCHTRPCVKTLRSANTWMNVPKIN